jgi:hypothetical protein
MSLLPNPKTELVLVLALTPVVRLDDLATRLIWYDESFSILLAEQGPAEIINSMLAADVDSSAVEEHPPDRKV